MARSAENSFAGTSAGTPAGETNWYRTFWGMPVSPRLLTATRSGYQSIRRHTADSMDEALG
jgi:hypothetical protein